MSIEALYQQYLGRAPDSAGLAHWTNALNSGTSLAQIAKSFQTSAESRQKYPTRPVEPAKVPGPGAKPDFGGQPQPAGPDTSAQQAQVGQLYANLLGRAPDKSGLQNYVDLLRSGVPEAEIARQIKSSPEYINRQAVLNPQPKEEPKEVNPKDFRINTLEGAIAYDKATQEAGIDPIKAADAYREQYRLNDIAKEILNNGQPQYGTGEAGGSSGINAFNTFQEGYKQEYIQNGGYPPGSPGTGNTPGLQVNSGNNNDGGKNDPIIETNNNNGGGGGGGGGGGNPVTPTTTTDLTKSFFKINPALITIRGVGGKKRGGLQQFSSKNAGQYTPLGIKSNLLNF